MESGACRPGEEACGAGEDRVVATLAALPDENFYVESADVDRLAKQLRGSRVLLYTAPRRSGKTTDAMAVHRRLCDYGIQVWHMLASCLVLPRQQIVCTTLQQVVDAIHA